MSEYVVAGREHGTTAAVYLCTSKKDTLLIGKNDTCGRPMNSFSTDGFHFEAAHGPL